MDEGKSGADGWVFVRFSLVSASRLSAEDRWWDLGDRHRQVSRPA